MFTQSRIRQVRRQSLDNQAGHAADYDDAEQETEKKGLDPSRIQSLSRDATEDA